MYFAQLGVWLVATIIVRTLINFQIKICVIIVQIFTENLLDKFANLILNPFNFDGRVKLIMVMVILPFFLDAFYFWVVDNILKLHPEKAPEIIAKKQYDEMNQNDTSKIDDNKEIVQQVEIQDLSTKREEEDDIRHIPIQSRTLMGGTPRRQSIQ